MLTVLDLFSGLGGFSLGLTRAGFRTVAFCEIEKYPQSILRKHWPGVPIFDDIRKLHATDLSEAIDVICGGAPCQPVSVAGKRRGTDDDRWLWPEMLRLIQECHPQYVIFENVPGIINMGLDTVFSDLESAGYETTTFIIPACAVNATHRRDRVWVIANAEGQRKRESANKAIPITISGETRIEPCDGCQSPTNTNGSLRDWRPNQQEWEAQGGIAFIGDDQGDVSNTDHPGPQRRGKLGEPAERRESSPRIRHDFARSDFERLTTTEWLLESTFCRGDDGISGRLDGVMIPGVINEKVPNRAARLKALGNSVVPQIVELIGRAIMAIENQ